MKGWADYLNHDRNTSSGSLMSPEIDPPPLSGPACSYWEVVAEFGPALARLAAAYEFNADQRQDLVQEISLALWRSLARFDQRCSIRTWVYRVAHNVAASHVQRRRRWRREQLFTLEELEAMPDPADNERRIDEASVLERLGRLIQELKVIDRDIVLLYLEGVDAAEIADVVGLSPAHIATKIHRIKALLMRRFRAGD
jgi:RNA polymerase sigma-70 factor, ECF subfamily